MTRSPEPDSASNALGLTSESDGPPESDGVGPDGLESDGHESDGRESDGRGPGDEGDGQRAPVSSDATAATSSPSGLSPAEVGALCERHGAAILRRCLAILRDRTEAEDAAQEVYIVLLRKGSQFRGEAQITTWIYRLTTNVCLNRIRASKRRKGREQNDAVDAWVNVAPRNPYEHLAHRTEVQTVLRSLDALDQQIFIYRYIDAMSQEEIATAVERSRKTVGKRLAKLQTKLKSHLAGGSSGADASNEEAS